MSRSSLLLLPTLSPASHMDSSFQQHPVLNLNHRIQNKRAAHSRYICPSHIFSTFLSMEIQLLITFANQNLHLKNNTKSFCIPVFTFPFGTFPLSHPAYEVLTFSKNSSKNHSFCLLLEADSSEAIHMF